jgi:hypothetical protein
MAHSYQAVQWNPQKRVYDATLAAGVLGYLALFMAISFAIRPNATIETLLIRGLGTASLLLLHGILCIGPLYRLDARFLPLLSTGGIWASRCSDWRSPTGCSRRSSSTPSATPIRW